MSDTKPVGDAEFWEVTHQIAQFSSILQDLAKYPAMLTVPQVAEVLQVSENGTYELVRKGEIPAMRFGRRVRVPKEQLVRFLMGQAEKGGVSDSHTAGGLRQAP